VSQATRIHTTSSPSECPGPKAPANFNPMAGYRCTESMGNAPQAVTAPFFRPDGSFHACPPPDTRPTLISLSRCLPMWP
jgi:hypothetical protein